MTAEEIKHQEDIDFAYEIIKYRLNPLLELITEKAQATQGYDLFPVGGHDYDYDYDYDNPFIPYLLVSDDEQVRVIEEKSKRVLVDDKFRRLGFFIITDQEGNKKVANSIDNALFYCILDMESKAHSEGLIKKKRNYLI